EFTANTGYARNAAKIIQDDDSGQVRAPQPPPPRIEQAALFDEAAFHGRGQGGRGQGGRGPSWRGPGGSGPGGGGPSLDELREEFKAQQQALAEAGTAGGPADA